MTRKLRCQHLHCDEDATRRLLIPVGTPKAKPLVMSYCDTHADAILEEPFAFPGAREVVVVND